MPVIDADAHVVESDRTWEYIEPSEQEFRPRIVDTGGGLLRQQWFIDGKIRGFPRPVGAISRAEVLLGLGRDVRTPEEASGMENVGVRLDHMTELGIDIQVVHPTIFIEQVADRPNVEVAICKAYNRWMADIWKQSNGRIRWTAPLPLLSMPDALDLMEFSKDNGAVGVFMRPIEGERLIPDPYFFPLYQKASDLDMAIAVHVGNANPKVKDVMSGAPMAGGFPSFLLPIVASFHAVIASGLPKEFPKLRFAFIEAAAEWVPYALKDIWRGGRAQLPDDVLKDYRIYVTTQTSDDIPYIVKYAGEDTLVIGTDYGHFDVSAEVDAFRKLEKEGNLEPHLLKKILEDNPAALYSI